MTADSKAIDLLRDIPDLIPVYREYYEDWNIKVFDRKQHECRNYVSPNRRSFYKVLLVTEGMGIFTIGLNTYHIETPTVLFIHPNDIISWKNLSENNAGFYCLFKKNLADQHSQLSIALEKYDLFANKSRNIISLSTQDATALDDIFRKMHREELQGGALKEDMMQTYLQLLLITCLKIGNHPKPDSVTDEYKYIHRFFDLLEQETAHINQHEPIKIKTAKEFAGELHLHPNHLNALLKQHTGQNVSSHIKSRLLEACKTLLAQTDWSIQNVGYSIGFADQSNFSVFFKKNTGFSPSDFRKTMHS